MIKEMSSMTKQIKLLAEEIHEIKVVIDQAVPKVLQSIDAARCNCK